MAVTPEAALAQSPNAQLTPEEAADAAELERRIDEGLLGVPQGPTLVGAMLGWSGAMWVMNFDGLLPPRLVAHIVRVYRQAGWMVKFDGIPSNVKGLNGQATIAGLRLTLEPVWERAAEVEQLRVEPGPCSHVSCHAQRCVGTFCAGCAEWAAGNTGPGACDGCVPNSAPVVAP